MTDSKRNIMSEAAGGLDLPIENPPLSGPAVDRLENRKEAGRKRPFTERELERNWKRVGRATIRSLKRLVSK